MTRVLSILAGFLLSFGCSAAGTTGSYQTAYPPPSGRHSLEGDALIAGGAVAVVEGATLAQGKQCFDPDWCMKTPKSTEAGVALGVVGLGMVLAGHAVNESDDRPADRTRRASAQSTPSRSRVWRLQRTQAR
jgi:hypothetical protein